MFKYTGILRRLMIFLLAFICLHGSLWSQQKSDSLMHLLEMAETNGGKITLLNLLAHDLRRSAPDSALRYAEEALELSRQKDDSLSMAESWYRIGMVHRVQFRLDEARDWLIKSQGVFERYGDH